MKFIQTIFTVFTLYLIYAATAAAHFGMVIPSSNIVGQEQKNISVTLSFSHPFEGIGMDMEKPKAFYVIKDGKKTDLLSILQKTTVMGHQAWSSSQNIKFPGVYHYVMEPVPYWEEAEDLFIIHYTKTIIAAFGEDSGWDQPVGLPTEIVPLLRPYGNYAGNSFVGQVLLNGAPAAQSEVEVEFYNEDKSVGHTSDYHITQVVKTDDSGIFTFSCPMAGWWGFSALNEADYTIKRPDNSEKTVELGAVLWVYFNGVKQMDAK